MKEGVGKSLQHPFFVHARYGACRYASKNSSVSLQVQIPIYRAVLIDAVARERLGFPRGEAVERSETDEEYGRRSDGLLDVADLLPRKDFGISLERCTEL